MSAEHADRVLSGITWIPKTIVSGMRSSDWLQCQSETGSVTTFWQTFSAEEFFSLPV